MGLARVCALAGLAALAACSRPPEFVAEEIHVEKNGCRVKAMLDGPRGFMSAPRVYAVVDCFGADGDLVSVQLFYVAAQAFTVEAAPSPRDPTVTDVLITRCEYNREKISPHRIQRRIDPIRPLLERAGLDIQVTDGGTDCPMNFPSDVDADYRSLMD